MNQDNRLVIIAKYREELGEKIVIGGFYPELCLFICSLKKWERVRRDTKAIVFGAREVDKYGRIEIPERLRRFANLKKEVFLVGCGDYIEIWDGKRWEVKCKENAESSEGEQY